nr:ATP-binding cassette domain-containing protein [Methylonatrum kenyense]
MHNLGIGSLHGVDLTVAPGEIVCLSGASGSGKSRLLRAVADLEPHDGEVTLGDLVQGRVPGHRWRAAVMLVPAESQWWAETVVAHFPPEHRLDLTPIGFDDAVMGWSVSRLSSGEKQRLALARAVARQPEALLLDEPTANLDADSIRRVETWLQELIRERRLPVLWVAHDQAQIERVGRRHFRLRNGTLEQA